MQLIFFFCSLLHCTLHCTFMPLLPLVVMVIVFALSVRCVVCPLTAPLAVMLHYFFFLSRGWGCYLLHMCLCVCLRLKYKYVARLYAIFIHSPLAVLPPNHMATPPTTVSASLALSLSLSLSLAVAISFSRSLFFFGFVASCVFNVFVLCS